MLIRSIYIHYTIERKIQSRVLSGLARGRLTHGPPVDGYGISVRYFIEVTGQMGIKFF